MSKALRLDRGKNKYILTFTVEVEADIYRREFSNYCQRENIDVTDVHQLQRAIDHCSTFAMWANHPQAIVVLQKQQEEEEEVQVPQKVWHVRASSSHMQELKEIALQTPVEQWDNLLTPLPEGGYKDKHVKQVYRLRYDEKMLLAQLRQQLEDKAKPERLELVASSVNGVRIK